MHSIETNPTIPTPWGCCKLKPTGPYVVSPVHSTAETQLHSCCNRAQLVGGYRRVPADQLCLMAEVAQLAGPLSHDNCDMLHVT